LIRLLRRLKATARFGTCGIDNGSVPIVKYHHERIDGKGYPYGLKNNEIPLGAKIVSIADTYHALTSDRPYRKGLSMYKAVAILEEGVGTQWDADLVRTFISIAPSFG